MLPRAGLYPGSDLANRRNVWMFSFLPPRLAESGGLAPQPVSRPICFRNSVRASADSLSKMAEDGRHARQSVFTDPTHFQCGLGLAQFVLQNGPRGGSCTRTYDVRSVAGCLLPHAEKLVRPPGFAPGLFLVRTEADCLVADGRVASVTGIAPACIRLEDGALICSRHTEKKLKMVPAAFCQPAEHLRPHPSEGCALITELRGRK